MANPSFEHYMYVLECCDGSLYAGYTTDVSARFAVHNAGKGAKCTRSRLPVRLLAQARFYTKQRAMSAEYHFKKLSRKQKDACLARLDRGEPFEKALMQSIPRFADEPVHEFIARELALHADDQYKTFQSSLIPNLEKSTMVGVRMPRLRKIAKQLEKRADLDLFMQALPHPLYEEQQLHALIINNMESYEEAVFALERFLPTVENWATCDLLNPKALKKDIPQSLILAKKWISSEHTYTARFGIALLLRHFLDNENFSSELLQLVAQRYTQDDYYLNMMRAWFFAECMAKQPEAALPYLLNKGYLDEWTRKKAIRKSCESFRVNEKLKNQLKA